ncbi:rap guanine nucleotide exchange factor 1-like isoform X4 [Portunus trituberculatus]|uniref:rap guanine nucleotide exchange factor 1-like isoform X4 n=1 Tax=Portunus trituberculatus TaxID=210409 RepID=UPI001E1CBA90|nr:rap guanine nucleotide exchange factor 1-like isoform X4 [Portunus trituberculatus]
MPQYHDAVLDHAGGGPKTVFWLDQPPLPARRPRPRKHAKSLLAALRKRRATYTVTPPTDSPPSSPATSPPSLSRSVSYTESRLPSWSRTPSPSPSWSRHSLWAGTITPSSSTFTTPSQSASPSPAASPPSTPLLGSTPPRHALRHSSLSRFSASPSPGPPTDRLPPKVVPCARKAVGESWDVWAGCTPPRPVPPTDCPSGRARQMTMTMEENTAQYRRWLQDTPKSGKGVLNRAISFKDKLGRIKSPLRQGELEKAEPSAKSESVDRKVENVWRSLRFYKDVVEKNTMYMLPGSATEVLEVVLALILALKPKFTNQNRDDASSSLSSTDSSSAVSSVIAGVHHSLAELVRWSDQRLLYEDDTHTSTQTVQEVVQVVRDAVQALIDLAADKENRYISDSTMSPSTLDNNNSIDKSPACYSNRNSEISNHRNSLPEIKQDSPIEHNGRYLLPGDTSGKLSHSRSSDSILTGVEVEAPPPKPPLPIGPDVAPPLPPKRKNQRETFMTHPHSIASPVSQSSRENSSDWLNPSHGPNSISGTLERSSMTNSSDQVSPASSLDSMNHPHDDPPASRTSLDSSGSLPDRSELDLDSNYLKHFNKSIDTLRISIGESNSMQYSSSSQIFKRNSQTVSIKQSSSQVDKCDNSAKCLLAPRWHDRPRLTPGRVHSTYDNLEQGNYDDSTSQEGPSPELPPKTRNMGNSSSTTTISSYESRGMLSNRSTTSSQDGSTVVQLRRQQQFDVHHVTLSSGDDHPPPLPEKKKHVHDYMRLFGQVAEPNPSELLRHSVHQMHLMSSMESHFSDHEQELIQGHNHRILNIEDDKMAKPPALPPKRRAHRPLTRQSSPPSSLPSSAMATTIDVTPDNSLVLAESTAYRKSMEEKDEPEEVIIKDQSVEIDRHNNVDTREEVEDEEEEDSLLDLLDVREYLILKKEGEEGPEIRGGPVDALIVHASKANKNEDEEKDDFLYQEAFLTTYRTFISPDELVHKLLKRYNRFVSSPDTERQRAAKNAFSLLVRLVDDLAIIDLSNDTLETLTDFEYGLLCRGELSQARLLRRKIVEKFEARKRHNASKENYNIASLAVTTKTMSLLDFKAQDIAEQMTLLDAELFLTMEIPEVLLWAREQNEERAPNLNKFTEHFNKMSYWARTRILEQVDAKDREKYVLKFTKIMKHLRKFNNFNSYLALLSALDSAPIRRLEWQKNITDGLKEYCQLIDSSSSFRAYRQALSESSPPCIPYIGLILQDLTFVHIGNNDLLPDGNVNFSKRWQQFNILLDNMKRFKKCPYNYKKNEKIITFLNNFDDYLNEEALWNISEEIKPRGGKKK